MSFYTLLQVCALSKAKTSLVISHRPHTVVECKEATHAL
jgi:hypothetical protein